MEMKDSGKREQQGTGAVRDSQDDKPRPALISPYADMREGTWLAIGARKYAERNWEKGMPISRCIESLERHLMAYKMGKTDEDHIAALRCNAGFILHYEEMIKLGVLPAELDDMPKYEQHVVGVDPAEEATAEHYSAYCRKCQEHVQLEKVDCGDIYFYNCIECNTTVAGRKKDA